MAALLQVLNALFSQAGTDSEESNALAAPRDPLLSTLIRDKFKEQDVET
jgi:hypothetical protein